MSARSPLTLFRPVLVLVLLAAALVALTGLVTPRSASAHAELDRAIPAQGEVLGAPPTTVELWFTEPVTADNGSLTVTLRTQDNTAIPASTLTVDPADPLHVIATFGGLGFETYTVVWTNQSATDGHQINGSYSFRIGGGPTPGAATTEGGSPALWAVVTRWLTFFGLAIAAGGFFAARALLATSNRSGDDGRDRAGTETLPAPVALRRLTLVGAVAALIGTVAEVPLQWLFPPAGAASASLANVLRGLPDAWWFRPVSALLAVVLAAAWLRLRRSPPMPVTVGIVAGSSVPVSSPRTAAGPVARTNPLIESLGLLAALAALLGLALTGHSAAQQGVWHGPAIASNILHQFSAALWAGGLVALAVVRWLAPREGIVAADPVRRFSPWALVLFAVAATTGVINAGIILPSIPALWESRYGVTILVKTMIVLGALGLAAWHRQALARSAAWATGRLRQSLRLEAILVALAVVAASTLALTSPPSGNALTRDPLLGNLTMLEQLHAPDGTVAGMLRMEVDPLRSNVPNTFHVTAASIDNAPVAIPDGSRVFLDFASVLDGAITQPRLELAADGQGGFAGQGDQLSIDSWWQITATVRGVGQQDQTATFHVLLPDPNLYGADAVDTPDSDPAAEALYQRAYDLTASAASYQNEQSISSADGTGVFEAETVIAAAGDQPTGYGLELQSYGAAGRPVDPPAVQRQIGTNSWRSSDAGATWISTFTVSGALSPADILEQYDGATGFRLGAERTVNGELSRAVIFAVPENRYTPTWYVWWVGEQSGLRQQELMITGGHYMSRIFTAYNSGVTVAPPDLATVVNTP